MFQCWWFVTGKRITLKLKKYLTFDASPSNSFIDRLPKVELQWLICDEAWWRHQMETFPATLAFCAGNSPVTDEFPAQRSVTRSFDVFSDLHLNKRLSKQSWAWWFETPSCPFWRHCNEGRFSLYKSIPCDWAGNTWDILQTKIPKRLNCK